MYNHIDSAIVSRSRRLYFSFAVVATHETLLLSKIAYQVGSRNVAF